MMPHHIGMVRSQCRIVASFGGGVATSLATIRLSPQAGAEQGLKAALTGMFGSVSNTWGPLVTRNTRSRTAEHGTWTRFAPLVVAAALAPMHLPL